MLPKLEQYRLEEPDRLMTPALLVYPELVDANIKAAIRMAGGDPARWRPHIKTTKIPAVVELLIANGVSRLKCSTTLELRVACQARADDVLLAFPVMGANAKRVREISKRYPATRVSVLVESAEQAALWRGSDIGIFIDVNSGMNRTGIDPARGAEIAQLASDLGDQFRGLHFYDGQLSGAPAGEREARAHEGYDRLMQLVSSLNSPVEEIITSGTPAAPYGVSYIGFRTAPFLHTISPGTIVFNDTTSLEQLPGYDFKPAVLVLSTAVSHPKQNVFTCDAGHKSVSADAGVPTCAVLGHLDWKPLRPSEEHLPVEVPEGESVTLGDRLYLLPRHVCPTVNLFDEAIFVVRGKVQTIVRVAARGHETTV